MRTGDVRVSVVMTTYNTAPAVLQEAIASLSAQEYPSKLLEVVLVDDGSTDEKSKSGIAELQSSFSARGWRILSIPNSYLGAARNAGVRNATGDAIMFMDDDNVAKPEEVSTFVAAMRRGGDVFTCLVDEFHHKVPADGRSWSRYMPTGNTELSWLTNTLGDANFFLTRAAWEAAGPFTEDRLAFEDWEFLHKAAMLNLSVNVLPEALFWKRTSRGSMLQTADHRKSALRAFRPSFLSTNPALRSMYLFAKSLIMKSDSGTFATVLHTVNDFSPLQGFNDVFYCYRPAAQPNALWTPLPAVSLPSWSQDENDFWYSLPTDSPLALSSSVMHSSVDHDVARVWRSRVHGLIRIWGDVSKIDSGGDGVHFTIMVGNITLFHRFTSLQLSFYVDAYSYVTVGQEVVFFAHSGKTHELDALFTSITITYDRSMRDMPPRSDRGTKFSRRPDGLVHGRRMLGGLMKKLA